MLTVTNEPKLSADTWSIFDSYRRPLPAWTWLDGWRSKLQSAVADQLDELVTDLETWDSHLKDLGGDPSRTDWSSFRPLRLSREEDWADWLAALFPEPLFLRSLFKCDAEATAILREEPLTTHRADLILLFAQQKRGIHIEMKLWDTQYPKTYPTAREVEDKFREVTAWEHFILIPRDNAALWGALARENNVPHVDVLYWDQVVHALRNSIRLSDSTRWKVWAHAYIGCIEQKILGLEPIRKETSGAYSAMQLMNMVLYWQHLGKQEIE
jgi:hypothetical protein